MHFEQIKQTHEYEFADFLRIRARELNLSHSEIARQSSIARQTWYRLLNSEIEEAKLSTLVSISRVLKVDVMQLIEMHLKKF